jgi:hypothetical protein
VRVRGTARYFNEFAEAKSGTGNCAYFSYQRPIRS